MKKFIFGETEDAFDSDDDLIATSPLPYLGQLIFRKQSSATQESTTVSRQISPPNQVTRLNLSSVPVMNSGSDHHEPPSAKQFRRICSEVIRGELFVSGWLVAEDWDQLDSRKITHVVNTACSVSKCPFQNEIMYLPLSIEDNRTEDIIAYVYPCIEFIESAISAGNRVLIHCMEGVSRSCSIAIAYLMWKRNLRYVEAQDLVQAARPVCQPNPNFMCQLLDFEKRLANTSSPKRTLRVTLRRFNDQLVLLTIHEERKPADKRFPYIYQDDSNGLRIVVDHQSQFKDHLLQLARDAADRLGRIEGFDPVIEYENFDPSILPVPTSALDADYAACYEFFQMQQDSSPKQHLEDPCTSRSHISHGSIDSCRDGNQIEVFQLDPAAIGQLGPSISFFDADDLDSRYMFLFKTAGGQVPILWIGDEVTDLVNTAGVVSKVESMMNAPISIVKQGREPQEFWELFTN